MGRHNTYTVGQTFMPCNSQEDSRRRYSMLEVYRLDLHDVLQSSSGWVGQLRQRGGDRGTRVLEPQILQGGRLWLSIGHTTSQDLHPSVIQLISAGR